MKSTLELKLCELIAELRDTQNQSGALAERLEGVMIKMYEEEQEGVTPPKPEVPQFKINPQIISLIKGEQVKFDMTAKNIADLRDYAFIEVHANTGTTVQFTYFTASTYTRMCFMTNMLPEVNQVLQAGGIYVVHNAKRKGKNFWDMAVACEGEPHQIQARAKKLAKLFAELKKEGKL